MQSSCQATWTSSCGVSAVVPQLELLSLVLRQILHNSIQCDVANFLYYAAYIIITTTIISLYFRVVLFYIH